MPSEHERYRRWLILVRLALLPIFLGAVLLYQQLFPIWVGLLCLAGGGGLLYLAWKY
jgi:hypothetical protein